MDLRFFAGKFGEFCGIQKFPILVPEKGVINTQSGNSLIPREKDYLPGNFNGFLRLIRIRRASVVVQVMPPFLVELWSKGVSGGHVAPLWTGFGVKTVEMTYI